MHGVGIAPLDTSALVTPLCFAKRGFDFIQALPKRLCHSLLAGNVWFFRFESLLIRFKLFKAKGGVPTGKQQREGFTGLTHFRKTQIKKLKNNNLTKTKGYT